MHTNKITKLVLMLLVIGTMIVSAACGGGKEPAPTAEPAKAEQPTQPPAATAAPAEPTQAPAQAAAAPEGLVTDVSNAKDAVIQIEAQGSFIDPEFGALYNAAGRGSGFIIDPEGIAVTNNHVVTGAALLKVWIGGDQGKSYNAKVLGVDECSDLAVIDIDGSGFPYMNWFDGPIQVGKEIYVAGFPLGDPEYSLSKGIISKEKADGETSWASVDSVIEYDATTNPGNSGGPVVTEDGQVVGVHYAGNASTRQAFGISRDQAKAIIEKLREGKPGDSIGVNGQAVASEDGSLVGVWVSSVESGSPADWAGIKGGDIITKMENLVLATDGTMSDYCDIIRSHDRGDALNVEVLRFATSELLEGQLNGRELEVVGNFSTGEDTSGGTTQAEDTGSVPATDVLDPNASASGDPYYATEFESPDTLNNWLYRFTNGQESGAAWEVADEKMRVELSDTDTWLYFFLDGLEVEDVTIGTKVENLGRNNNNVSLLCRASEDGWYEFNIANNGKYWIYRFDEATGDYYAIYNGGSTAIKTGRGVNEYIAICNGDTLTLIINGTLVREVKDSTLGSGQVGFSLSSFDVTPIIAEFDYFVALVP